MVSMDFNLCLSNMLWIVTVPVFAVSDKSKGFIPTHWALKIHPYLLTSFTTYIVSYLYHLKLQQHTYDNVP